jgi:hypothetical protein
MNLGFPLVLLLSLSSAFALIAIQAPKTKNASGAPIISSFEPSATSLGACLVPVKPDLYRTVCLSNRRTTVTLQVTVAGDTKETLSYHYSTTVGQIIGEGARVTWNLEGANHGTHKVTVTVRNSRGGESTAFTTVVLAGCNTCVTPDLPCPTVVIKDSVQEAHRGEHVVFDVIVSQPEFLTRPDYIWSIKGGKIVRGDHSPRVEVLVTGDIDAEITATVQVTGFDPSCTGTSASHELPIKP